MVPTELSDHPLLKLPHKITLVQRRDHRGNDEVLSDHPRMRLEGQGRLARVFILAKAAEEELTKEGCDLKKYGLAYLYLAPLLRGSKKERVYLRKRQEDEVEIFQNKGKRRNRNSYKK